MKYIRNIKNWKHFELFYAGFENKLKYNFFFYGSSEFGLTKEDDQEKPA